jgi:hypothetical protein
LPSFFYVNFFKQSVLFQLSSFIVSFLICIFQFFSTKFSLSMNYKNLPSLVKLLTFTLVLLISISACNQQEEITEPFQDDLTLENGDVIKGKYIVVLNEGAVDKSSFRNLKDFNGRQLAMRKASAAVLEENSISSEAIEITFSNLFDGFSATLDHEGYSRLQQDTRVKYIEKDRVVIMRPPWERNGGDGGGGSGQTTPYGITRVGGAVNYGGNNSAWIIDTGIQLDHPDLNVDLSKSITVFTSGKDSKNADDGNGHGTHVAGTIAAINNNIGVVGVAAGASVVAVKVLDSRGSGSYSGVIAGVDYVGANANPGDVANMSLGGPYSKALNDAVIAASNKGVWFAIAAGNDGKDANGYSPASANGKYILTISAMDEKDVYASFSNFGNPPIDFCAPGVRINSTWIGSGYRSISGTSMAAPHAAGVLLVTGGNAKTSGTVKNDPDGTADVIISHK